MVSYPGRHAELYDVIYAEKDYLHEGKFVAGLLEKFSLSAGKKVLELACGTGRHAMTLESLGYDVTATDYSADMIKVAQKNAAPLQSKVTFTVNDMRSLGSDLGEFDGVVCLFDSIGYVQTNESIRAVFSGVHERLKKDGIFIFEYWHAAAMLRSYEPLRVKRIPLPNGELVRISETKIDAARQLASVSYDLIELSNAGTYTRTCETQTNRFFLLGEMEQILDSAGFDVLSSHAGFTDSQQIDENTWHVVAVVRRK
jgi:cyclopropane fatty-acyl-phospholipid synthase-like methyltransferase